MIRLIAVAISHLDATPSSVFSSPLSVTSLVLCCRDLEDAPLASSLFGKAASMSSSSTMLCNNREREIRIIQEE